MMAGIEPVSQYGPDIGFVHVTCVLVAGYVLYMAWMIASGFISGESTMSLWCVILFCTLFAGGAVFFIIYAVRSFIKALKAAEISETCDTEGR